jgi:RHS repeat-associated protein
VTPPSDNLPPDPSDVAPPLDATAVTSFADAISFLYSGANPIQKGVIPDALDSLRAGVIRGRVLDRAGNPLPAVSVTVHRHSELGSTMTRADGMFDIVVNGGGPMTVRFVKPDFLPADRQLQVPWNAFAFVPDVTLVQLDPQVTTIDLSPGPASVARGSVVTDADGTRQATLIFAEGGTMANMELADGTVLPALARLNVRATEYTVGANGPGAMPAQLPATSAYTYAAEFSADEAIVAGARRVTFDPAVVFYLENFLKFPVGSPVPFGYYDRETAAWIPSRDGRVIRILSINNGEARIDANGDGSPDDAAGLAALGVTLAERHKLATLYVAGQSLWRVPVTHFSSPDANWPAEPTPGAVTPNQPIPDPDPSVPNPSCRTGSVVECEHQVLRESIGVTGTPFSLNYASHRVPGRKAAYTLTIPLIGASVPPNLKRIDLDIQVAGRRFRHSVGPAAQQSYAFTWDGNDAYGRAVSGTVPATIRIGYVYPLVYQVPRSDCGNCVGDAGPSFGLISGIRFSNLTILRGQSEGTLWQQTQKRLGILRAPLGGWSVSNYHAYDPWGKILYKGDGTRRDGQSALSAVITTVAGTGVPGSGGDGGPATKAQLNSPFGLAAAPDGSLYIADAIAARIRRVDREGIITTVAGTGSAGFSGDGGLATQAQLNSPRDVAVGLDGSLYIADTGNRRIRRIAPDQIITTIAGSGEEGSTGDWGPATRARFFSPQAVAVAPDGSVYVADSAISFIRRIGPDGVITHVAGVSGSGFPGDGGPAPLGRLSSPLGIDVAPDGSLYIADLGFHRVARVGPDGILTTVAGIGNAAFNGDGLPARQTGVHPGGVTVAPDGTTYITDINNRIRFIDADGIVTTIAGTGANGFTGDGGWATQAALSFYSNGGCLGGFACDGASVAVSPDGTVYIADVFNRRVRRVTPSAMPGVALTDIALASEDGAEVYVFTSSGRHIRTLNAVTGALLYQFDHDSSGQLVAITDGNANRTSIGRDGGGNPVAIVAPDGQRTTLTVHGNGYLASISNPAGEAHNVSYTTDGLLTTFTDPNGHMSSMQYDTLGRLTRDQNAADGFWTLNRAEQARSYSVDVMSAENRKSVFKVEELSTRDERRTYTAADGTTTQTIRRSNGTSVVTTADGTVFTSSESADPRFGMQSPFTSRTTVQLPSGLAMQTTTARSATLAQPGNPLSLLTETTETTLNGRLFRNVYDGALRQHTLTTPMGRQQLLRADEQGRPVMAQIPGVEAVHYAYDTRGRLASIRQGQGPTVRTTTFEYDSQGYLASTTDPLGRTHSFIYDAAGQMDRQTSFGGRVVQFDYDVNGSLTSLTPPGRPAHTFAYTPVNLLEEYTPPTGAASSTSYVYNRDRQLTGVNRPDGQALRFAYDDGGRLVTMTTPTGVRTYIHDASGRQSAIVSPAGRVEYTFDGALPLTETWTGTVFGSVHHAYNNDLAVRTLSVNGATISLAYDDDGLLTRAGALTLQRSAANGAIQGTSLGAVSTSANYTGFGELDQLTGSQGGVRLLDMHYTRDHGGRVTQKLETIGGESTTVAYAYDPVGRLSSVTSSTATTTYTYDANGNRTGHDGVTATYDSEDRLITYGTNRYTYTFAGELATKIANGMTTTYVYDVLGNLTRATLSDGTVIDYTTDALDRRIGKRLNGAPIQGFLYESALRPIAELDGASNVVSRFVYATRMNVPDYMVKAGQIYQIVSDQLGSPRLVVNTATGAIAQRMDYDAFGNVLGDTNPGFQPFGFAGGLYDTHTRLVRFGARDYDAETGRWTAIDPIRFHGGDTNLYSYSGNDPVNSVDPEGLSSGRKWRIIFETIKQLLRPEDASKMAKPYRDIEELVEQGPKRMRKALANDKPDGGSLMLLIPTIDLDDIVDLLLPDLLVPSPLGCSTLTCDNDHNGIPDRWERDLVCK